ncbi:MAG: YebC/PmpR family DNA-binding transcriptional regulator [Pseudomonadota bacterium]|nr:YebC/PmpR family DNA-binding transcriptional regulator [Pseudomonadota bacterium]MEC8000133.1 YebC/PmpR family DNA-binding transcriptional regulator [Pseudomonadota bacterium]
MAGHSKWANIKHRKARQDAKRGKIYTKLIRELTVAAKAGGGDPADNPRLRLALDKANSENMPKDTIKRAIERGTGAGESGNLEEVTYEGYGPGGVAILVEAMTDNRNRTVAEVRHAFTKFGGNLGTDGSVSYLFNKIGFAQVDPNADEEIVMDILLENDGEDLEVGSESIDITVPFQNLSSFVETLKNKNIGILNAEVTMRADTSIALDQETGEKLLRILDFLEDVDDVQEVHSNAEFPDNFEPGD